MKNILVTGGAGYIGSHTIVQLFAAGYQPLIFDNWCNANRKVLVRLKEICGREIPAIDGDLRDREQVEAVFKQHAVDAVIHFAGLKAVGESHSLPLEYYQNNVGGSLVLLDVMRNYGVKKLVFSSSATVYGDPASVPIKESAALSTTNPYGETKLMIERICRDLAASDSDWSIALLRYFNPVGAHPSGLIGEDPNGIPNNLVPFIAQVAVGRREHLNVFGDDYDTVDGTGVRDYIHVEDLAAAHVSAVAHIDTHQGCDAYNIGTGRGYSVLQVVEAFREASEKTISYQIAPRRAGDIATCYADATLAKKVLGWEAKHGIEQMMLDHWRWQSQNPNGYA